MAWVRSTVGFQPLMVPSSVAKMNNAGPERSCALTTKSGEPLNTIPVREPGPSPVAEGIATTSCCGTPWALQRVESPVTWSLTQKGEAAADVSPQAFTRWGSLLGALPG